MRKGEVLVDKEQFQPVLIVTELAKGVPLWKAVWNTLLLPRMSPGRLPSYAVPFKYRCRWRSGNRSIA